MPMRENEQRYVCADAGPVRARLPALGATGPEREEQADHYFNAPDRDFARTDEAFRLRRVGPQLNYLTFKGPKARADIRTRGEEPIHVPVAGEVDRVDPTGVGDAFRAGFLVGLQGGLGHERAAQIGSVLATYVLETVGTQEYVVTRRTFLDRVAAAYGESAAFCIRSTSKVAVRRRPASAGNASSTVSTASNSGSLSS